MKLHPDPAQLGSDITTLSQLHLLHQWNANSMLQFAAQKLTAQHNNMSTKQVWDKKAGIALHKAAMTYMPLYNLRVFIEKIESLQDTRLIDVLT